MPGGPFAPCGGPNDEDSIPAARQGAAGISRKGPVEKGLLFTYAMTYGGAVVGLFRPFAGLLIYVCFAIIKPEALWYWSVPEGNYSRIIAIVLLVGWVVQGCGAWRLGKAWTVVLALLGYWVWSALSAFGASDQESAWRFVES